VFVRFACQGRKSDTKEEQGRKWLAHNSQRVNHADSEGKANFPCMRVEPEGSAAVALRIGVDESESGKSFPFFGLQEGQPELSCLHVGPGIG
jgi:hypothetical protein